MIQIVSNKTILIKVDDFRKPTQMLDFRSHKHGSLQEFFEMISSSPLISITSAAYNVGPMLLDMVKSIFTQSFSGWELVMADNGSTDNSFQLARSIDDA